MDRAFDSMPWPPGSKSRPMQLNRADGQPFVFFVRRGGGGRVKESGNARVVGSRG